MSRIWDAVKSAEREKVKGRGQASQRAPEHEQRKSTRRALRVPLFVYGNSRENMPFLEATDSMGVNENGALLIIATHVVVGQRLMLINRQNGMEQECTVVRVGKRGYKMPVGVRFTQPCPEFWEAASGSTFASPQLAAAHASR